MNDVLLQMTFVHAGVVSGTPENLVDGYVHHSDLEGIYASWGAEDTISGISEYWVAIGSGEGELSLQITISTHKRITLDIVSNGYHLGHIHTGSGSVPDSSKPNASGRLSVGFAFTLLYYKRLIRREWYASTSPCTHCVCFATGCDPITCT